MHNISIKRSQMQIFLRIICDYLRSAERARAPMPVPGARACFACMPLANRKTELMPGARAGKKAAQRCAAFFRKPSWAVARRIVSYRIALGSVIGT
jgi:hypothetical protein